MILPFPLWYSPCPSWRGAIERMELAPTDGSGAGAGAFIDKRGVKIMRDGRLAQISDFRENDQLTATVFGLAGLASLLVGLGFTIRRRAAKS